MQDVLSAFYYVRTLDLEVGRDVFLAAHSSKKTYEMRVIVHRRETVKTDLGTFDCFVVQPIMLGEGLFKQEGDLVIYITADERRIPVLMKTKLPVGSITASLKEFTLAPPPGGGRWLSAHLARTRRRRIGDDPLFLALATAGRADAAAVPPRATSRCGSTRRSPGS